ncbi:MAG TPA: TMEM175 family protein [Vicinamibacterales bacterium]|nr:TMEM175 family protein [Vicinamibacterales bacterium]
MESSATGRLEAFSDGVFAIAITLLILDLRVPHAADLIADAETRDLAPAAALLWKLGHMWPNFLAYFMSFAVVLVLWVNHHRVFTIVRRTDRSFMFWNGLLLLFVTFVPFPTALLAEYMADGDWGQFRIGALVYAGNGLMIAAAFRAMWSHAIGHGHLLPDDHDPAAVKAIDDEYRWAPAASVVIFLIAFVWPWASVGLSLALVLAFSVQGFMNKRPFRRRREEGA